MTDTQYLNNKMPFSRVLLLGEKPVRSAPTLSLAIELNRLGITTQFADLEYTSTRKWMQQALQAQVVIFVLYPQGDGDGGGGYFFLRQIQRARRLGCTIIRWWVGTDVLRCLDSPTHQKLAQALSNECALNIAVSPHLVTELQEIGIEAEYLPSPCDLTILDNIPPAELPKGVLAYLPGHRRAFYGEKVLIEAIEANPDLEFFIVSDDSHSLQHYSNVTSLGWVEDMGALWQKVGLVLRVTLHDGMPRMVLEALARSRYVVYSQRFEACWYATSGDEVLKHIERFKILDLPNIEGRAAVSSIAVDAAPRYVQRIAEYRAATRPMQRLLSLILPGGKKRTE
jgi:hypothetical protein